MSTSRRLLLFAAIVAAVCSAAALEPTLSFSVSPEPGNHDLVPTAPPLVLNSTAAFLCWSYYNSYDAHCRMVSPADATFQAPWVNLSTANADQFQDLPLPLFSNPVSAIYSVSQATGSYFAASSSTTALQPLSRNVSTARCATDPFSHTAFIPYGVKEGDDALLAIATLPEKGNTALYALQPWSFKNKTYPNGLSLLHDVIWYRGLLLFMHNNTFYNYDSTTGLLKFSVPDPCGVGLERNSMNLARGTFGFDANGDLDAFIIYGNTSTASQAQFVVCRISHNDGNTKWKYVMAEDFVVEDIIGGSGVLLLSGYAVTTGAPQYTTHILDAATNVSYGFIPRSFQDKQSFPSFVPPSVVPPECGGAIVLQQHTNLTAFCFNPIIINRTVRAPLWSVTVGCLRRPIYEAISNQILCVDGTYVSSVEPVAGSLVWQIARSVTFQPMIMVENTVPYLFVFDSDANLVGYQLPYVSPSTPTPGAPPQGDAPSSGLSGGAAAGIAIGVILAVVAGAGTAFYFTRSRRRYTSADSKSMNQEYGSLT